VHLDQSFVTSTTKLLAELDGVIGQKERAPKLALLELDWRLRRGGVGGRKEDAWKAAVRSYWEVWGGKGCVVEDLLGVVQSDEGRESVIRDMLEAVTKGHVRARSDGADTDRLGLFPASTKRRALPREGSGLVHRGVPPHMVTLPLRATIRCVQLLGEADVRGRPAKDRCPAGK
jgi:hypothetical protein